MLNFIRRWNIRHLLSQDTTASLLLSLCVSHLDYCNSILYGLPRQHHKENAMYSEHVCTLSTKKNQIGQCDSIPRILTLATNQTKNNFQTLHAYI